MIFQFSILSMLGSQVTNTPKEYICPITHKLMKNPVAAADGRSYEEAAIVKWINEGNRTSPTTGERMRHGFLAYNESLKTSIEIFKAQTSNGQEEKFIDSEKITIKDSRVEEAKKIDQTDHNDRPMIINNQLNIQEGSSNLTNFELVKLIEDNYDVHKKILGNMHKHVDGKTIGTRVHDPDNGFLSAVAEKLSYKCLAFLQEFTLDSQDWQKTYRQIKNYERFCAWTQ